MSRDLCGDYDNGFCCTFPAGHGGDLHVATTGMPNEGKGDIAHAWKNDNPKPDPAVDLVNLDARVREYAEKLQGIYDSRTAGSYTFIGVLAEFYYAAIGQALFGGTK